MDAPAIIETLDHIVCRRSAALTEAAVSEWSQGFRFEGHAAVFDEVADLGPFTEEVQRGSFRRVLAGGGHVPMLYEHNAGLPLLASTRSGTLRLTEDKRGLAVAADVADPRSGATCACWSTAATSAA